MAVTINNAMTDEIRKQVKIELVKRDMNQVDLAKATGMSPGHISMILTGNTANLPGSWHKILDALGLKIVIAPKDAEVIVRIRNGHDE